VGRKPNPAAFAHAVLLSTSGCDWMLNIVTRTSFPIMFKKVEWPGIATTVGLALIATLIIVGSKDDLKDWQPLMAAVLAQATARYFS